MSLRRSSACFFRASVFITYGNWIIKSSFPELACSSTPSNKDNFLIKRCIVELGSFITAYKGFSTMPIFFLANHISSFLPDISLYNLTFTESVLQSIICPVRIDKISYELLIFGSSVVSTGTIATHPSSNNDEYISCMNALAV